MIPTKVTLPPLPIDACLAELKTALAAGSSAVLVAPPGAGKTTRVPLALLDIAGAPGRGDGNGTTDVHCCNWLGERKILLLEPRRLAARGAASQMARVLGERVGETVGLRTRLATQVGPKTRIEVITEGVFTRMILNDATLDGIGAVLFDEYHERSLDADLGLALALDAQAGLRPDLRLIVMSATIDGARVARLMHEGLGSPDASGAPVVTSQGRMFAVDTRYIGAASHGRIEDEVTAAVVKALAADEGSILAFLPGQAEIRRTAERLRTRLADPTIDVTPLYGGLDQREQDAAIAPAPPGRRKVVLATSIAETSLTIDGIRIVIDCGRSRVPRYEPGSGLTRLETVRVSRAAADQRRGRAGRLGPGVCYRMWSEPETQSLPAFAEPEIRNADLSQLLLDCAGWGVTDPTTLRWLDAPPAAALETGRAELLALGALTDDGRLTALGCAISRVPLPPRLAVMLIDAAASGHADLAASIAAVLVERGLGGGDTDLSTRLSHFRSDRSQRADDMRKLSRQWAAKAERLAGSVGPRPSVAGSAPAVLALAYPDRIARSRGSGGAYLLVNGRAAKLDDGDPLSRQPFLVVAEITGSAGNAHIRLAAALDERELKDICAGRIKDTIETVYDTASSSVKSRKLRRLGSIVLAVEPRPVQADEDSARVLCAGLIAGGLDRLPWTRSQLQWRERIGFLRTRLVTAVGVDIAAWPDLSDTGLTATALQWLLPCLDGKTALSQVSADDLGRALETLVPWDVRQRLETDAPSHFTAPTGNRFTIDYAGPLAPCVSIRVQELFGIERQPSIGGGRIALTLELLSPAHRPIQITRDLPGFWAGSWAATRADLRGRYPKHEWPENPAAAAPTARAKPRR